MARDLRILAIRRQTAGVLAFLDEVVRLMPGSLAHPFADAPLAEELTRLGGLILDVAGVFGGEAGPPVEIALGGPAARTGWESRTDRTDGELKKDIDDELRWDSEVHGATIRVSVDEGRVSLRGAVPTRAEKWAAECAVRRIGHVAAVTDDLTVRAPVPHPHTDADLTEAALKALFCDVQVPRAVTASVHQGRVTLEGQVEWNFQRESADHAVRYLSGVVSVRNAISIRDGEAAVQVTEEIEGAA